MKSYIQQKLGCFIKTKKIMQYLFNLGKKKESKKLTIVTNKKSLFGRIENVGGTGYMFNIKEISNFFNKKIELIGFEGNMMVIILSKLKQYLSS